MRENTFRVSPFIHIWLKNKKAELISVYETVLLLKLKVKLCYWLFYRQWYIEIKIRIRMNTYILGNSFQCEGLLADKFLEYCGKWWQITHDRCKSYLYGCLKKCLDVKNCVTDTESLRHALMFYFQMTYLNFLLHFSDFLCILTAKFS